MKRVWLWICLILNMFTVVASSQERRDPTVPGAGYQPRVQPAISLPDSKEEDPLVLKALVLRDADHGVALIQTSTGSVRVTLDRSKPSELTIAGRTYTVSDFSRSSIQLRSGSQVRMLSPASR